MGAGGSLRKGMVSFTWRDQTWPHSNPRAEALRTSSPGSAGTEKVMGKILQGVEKVSPVFCVLAKNVLLGILVNIMKRPRRRREQGIMNATRCRRYTEVWEGGADAASGRK